MKKFSIFVCINIALIFFVLVGTACYTAACCGALTLPFRALWIKGITSFGFLLLGAVNLCYMIKVKQGNFKFGIVMVTGLAFAMVADVALNLHFITGAALFAVGHIFYFASYCLLQKFRWQDLIYGAIIFVPSVLFITLAPIFKFGGALMEVVCVIYAIIISCMVGKSISNLVKERNLLNTILVVGSILFFFSDLMLLINNFASSSIVTTTLCLITYYPAQILLACGILISALGANQPQQND